MKKNYTVTFLTKKGGEQWWKIHLEANNVKEAKQLAKDMWTSPMHMFDIYTRKLPDDKEFKYHTFTRIEWDGTLY